MLHQSVKELELARSKYIVEKYHSEKSEHPPHLEIPSNSIQKMNYNDRNNPHFDETNHHRNFDVIRTHASNENLVRDVKQDAEIQSKAVQERIIEKTRRLQELKQVASRRYKKAITEVAMDQRKVQLLRDMKDIEITDRSRKQVNASRHAEQFRAHYVYGGADRLAQAFQSQFQIGFSSGILRLLENANNGTSRRPISRRPLDTISNSSFEFLSDGPSIVKLNRK
jgi:hypothetical protein